MPLANKQPTYNSDINVTPMVDVMLVLLIIFMVVTPMLQKSKLVNMVQTNNQMEMKDADRDDAIIVAVLKDGTVYLDTEKVTVETVAGKLTDKFGNRPDKPKIFLKADARARYGDVLGTVDAIRSTGVAELGLLTESAKKKMAPGAP